MKGTKSNFRAPLVVNFELDYLCDTMPEVIHFQLTYQKTKQRNKKTQQIEKTTNSLLANVPILHPLKTPKNQRFSFTFRGVKRGISVFQQKGHIFFHLKKNSQISSVSVFVYFSSHTVFQYKYKCQFLKALFSFFYQNIYIVAKNLPSPNIHLKYLVFLGKTNKYD